MNYGKMYCDCAYFLSTKYLNSIIGKDICSKN